MVDLSAILHQIEIIFNPTVLINIFHGGLFVMCIIFAEHKRVLWNNVHIITDYDSHKT